MNIDDHEDAARRDEKLERLFGVMIKETDPDLKQVMEKENKIKEKQFKRKIDKISRYHEKGRLLDVGSAQGVFLSLAVSYESFGLEPSKYTYRVSKKNALDSTIYNCTLLEAGFPDCMFDVVTLINTLEHLLRPEETLAEIHRILKPGGLLMVETPDAGHIIPRLMGKWWFQFMIPDHVVFFSKRQLCDILNGIGFEIRETGYPWKTVSINLLLLHANRYLKKASGFLTLVFKNSGILDKTISFPQYDEMIVWAVKQNIEKRTSHGTF